MKNRCKGKSTCSPELYVGKGIGYPPEWERFENFLEDMGEQPLGFSLDRIDNSKGYSKENCRWVPWQVQMRNRGLFKKSRSGVTGVLQKKNGSWVALLTVDSKQHHLYQGKDFFEACCARKSAEVRYGFAQY